MRIYCLVAFWMGTLSLFIYAGYIMGDYPRIQEKTLGQDLLVFITTAAFMVWVGNLLWNWL